MSCSLVVPNTNYPQSVKDFSIYLGTVLEKSENTISGYKTDLTLFYKFILVHKGKLKENVDFDDIDITKIGANFIRTINLKDLYAFMVWLKDERDNGASARARKVATLKSYFKYLYKKEKMIKENIAEELQTPKLSRRQPEVLTIEDCKNLLQSLDKENKFYSRDYCILTLFLNCGIRLNELTNIKIADIKNDILTIIGKGNKERKVYLNNSCLRAISNYLNVRDDSKCDYEDKKYLFLSRENRQINKRSIQTLTKKHFENAGLDTSKIHTHSTRATFATIQHDAGVDLASLQVAMGHSSPMTTTLYLNINEEKLRKISKNNPLNKL